MDLDYPQPGFHFLVVFELLPQFPNDVRFQEVTGDLIHAVVVHALQALAGATVESAPVAEQNRAVGGFLGEDVLEGVGTVGQPA